MTKVILVSLSVLVVAGGIWVFFNLKHNVLLPQNQNIPGSSPTAQPQAEFKKVQTATSKSGNLTAKIVSSSKDDSNLYYLQGSNLKTGHASTPKLLGDRIQIVDLTVDDPGATQYGLITVDYLDHAKGAPLTDDPTEHITKKFEFESSGDLIEVLH